MNPELIIAAMLDNTSLTNLVSDRIATPRLPTNTTYPAVVYRLISHVPRPHINTAEEQHALARFQITAIGKTIASVKEIQTAIRGLLDHKQGILSEEMWVIYCRLDAAQPIEHDDDLDLWYQPADYLLMYYE